jgi:hypothetical protein
MQVLGGLSVPYDSCTTSIPYAIINGAIRKSNHILRASTIAVPLKKSHGHRDLAMFMLFENQLRFLLVMLLGSDTLLISDEDIVYPTALCRRPHEIM